MNPTELKMLLQKYQLEPSKRLGQNFLIDQNILYKIIAAADLSARDTVLEVGPGLGILTLAIAKSVKKIIAVEKDKQLSVILAGLLIKNHIKNVEIINQDILRYAPNIFSYKLVANLPYYLTSALIRKFLEIKFPPSEMILMIQKEVAKRICSQPPKMNLLAVATQFYGQPRIIAYVSKNSFWPKPKVDSAIIKIKPLNKRPALNFTKQFFIIVKAGFAAPRKQLINNLIRGLKISRPKLENFLKNCGVSPQRRAETLTLKEWRRLAKQFLKNSAANKISVDN